MTFFNLCFVHTYKCQYLRLKINSPFMQWRVIFFFSSPPILQAIKRHCFPIFLVVQTAISWGQYREILFSSAPFSQIETASPDSSYVFEVLGIIEKSRGRGEVYGALMAFPMRAACTKQLCPKFPD